MFIRASHWQRRYRACEAAIQLQQDRQADTGLGGCQADHQDEHDLSIRLRPT